VADSSVRADFVGPLYGNGGKHAGYNGWTIAQLLTVAEQAMAVHQPTHILLMAGKQTWLQVAIAEYTVAVRRCPCSPRRCFVQYISCIECIEYVPCAGTNDFFFLGDPQSPWGANATTGVARMSQLLDLAFRTLPEVNTLPADGAAERSDVSFMIACGQVTVLLSGVTHINATLCAE